MIKDLKEELCGEQECELTTELPRCVDDGLNNEISNSSFYAIVKRDTDSTVPLQKAKKPAKVEIFVKISKNLHLWKHNSTRSENVRKVKEELKKLNSSEKLKKRLRNMNIDLTSLKLDEMITCNPGSIAKKLTCGKPSKYLCTFYVLQNLMLILFVVVQCSRGTFHDAQQNICLPCPIGTFNGLIGQTKCVPCPDFHSTRKNGSRSIADCRKLCPPGNFARNKTSKKNNSIGLVKTLMPFCRSCFAGEYQPKYDQMSCDLCPDGKTSERGSISIDNCYDKYENSCYNLTCGEHGKCISNKAFYICECQGEYYGERCELKYDKCALSPCFNGGTCKHLNDTSVECECSSGYSGWFCENFVDPCSEKNCQNGGACTELFGNATCDCLPGYEGDLCDRQLQIDFCSSSPCDSRAACINKNDIYECICAAGSIGKRFVHL